MLTKVKTVTNETLDPSKHASYSPNRSISEILHSAGVRRLTTMKRYP